LHDLGDETRKFIDEILELSLGDPAAAEAEADDLPQGTIAMMVSASYEWRGWQAARALKDLRSAGDWVQIMGHLRVYGVRIDNVFEWTDKVPGYRAALDGAVIAQIKSFAAAYNRSPDDPVLDALAQRPAIDETLKAMESDSWQPDQDVATSPPTPKTGARPATTDCPHHSKAPEPANLPGTPPPPIDTELRHQSARPALPGGGPTSPTLADATLDGEQYLTELTARDCP
jgi:hypothetical protein